MDYKVVVSDPESGRSYQREVKDEKAARLNNLKIGDEFDGSIVGLAGYTLKITGGSEKSGFPMKKGVQGTSRPEVLMTEGVGYRPKTPVRRRKRVRGEKIADDIVQINTAVVKRAKKSMEEFYGLATEEKKDAEAKEPSAEPSEEVKEEKKEWKAKETAKEEKEAPKEAKE
ncbi:MAG: 30S ribosomal protein S6e [Candidatus Altiarchaeota archaeon]|nr:30S ribosomal protein S6e [Candidatus Altiarchaeota archaeon]